MSFAYPQRQLFTDWSARVLPGVTLLRGGEGSGKTTLLRLLAGELPADAGRLQVRHMAKLSAAAEHLHIRMAELSAAAERLYIGLADQPDTYRQQLFLAGPRGDEFDQMTVDGYFESEQRRHPGFDTQALPFLMDGLSLAAHRHKHLYMLSTGSKRKVWLAAAFACGAAVTLLDQPFAALDKASIGFVTELLEDAAGHSSRAWMVSDFEAPASVPLAAVIDLGG